MTTRLIIEELITNDIDGETMQYIIERVGMRDQMLRQLVLSAKPEEIAVLMKEREMYKDTDPDLEAQDYNTFGNNKI